MHKFLGRQKIINPLGQKPAFGWFLSCVGTILVILTKVRPNIKNVCPYEYIIYRDWTFRTCSEFSFSALGPFQLGTNILLLEEMAALMDFSSRKWPWHTERFFFFFFLIAILDNYEQGFTKNVKTLNSEVFNFISLNSHSNFKKTCYFEASKGIMTKFKSQAFHIIRIKYWKASGIGNPPSLNPVPQKILGLKMKFYVLFCTRLYFLPGWFGEGIKCKCTIKILLS